MNGCHDFKQNFSKKGKFPEILDAIERFCRYMHFVKALHFLNNPIEVIDVSHVIHFYRGLRTKPI